MANSICLQKLMVPADCTAAAPPTGPSWNQAWGFDLPGTNLQPKELESYLFTKEHQANGKSHQRACSTLKSVNLKLFQSNEGRR